MMNQRIKVGFYMALPALITIPYMWLIGGIGYIIDIQIDANSSNHLFFFYWTIGFTILALIFSFISFIYGVLEKPSIG